MNYYSNDRSDQYKPGDLVILNGNCLNKTKRRAKWNRTNKNILANYESPYIKKA